MTHKDNIITILEYSKNNNTQITEIVKKVLEGQRINSQEGLILFKQAELGLLGSLANFVREKKHGDKTFFNKNFHIEPTNICIYSCKFCSYSRKVKEKDAWEHSLEEILDIVRSYENKDVTEVHIVGGVHPKRDIEYYGEILKQIKIIRPSIHIKAFTAVELEYMFDKSGMSAQDGFKYLKSCGLDSIPGGGAEIFDEQIRKQICDEKASSQNWLTIHETAHKSGIPSNATMLYGHIENYEHRIDHMSRIRDLQDKTGGFNTFIPLKYRSANNKMTETGEVSAVEDLRNYAVSRIFMDNVEHLKAYWPAIGKSIAQLSLSFGVDDIDGTVDDSTKIYSMAGAEDKNPVMTTESIVALIKEVNRTAVERDTLYNTINTW